MYEEKRESFSIKDLFLQLLFIVLLVFILIWLFPTKGYLENRLDGIQEGLKPLYTRLFTDNITTMKEAAKGYFTTPRLPKNIGDKVTMTLNEMYNKGLLLQLVDNNNKACDASSSYVEITKSDAEYVLKTTLSCSDKEAYVIEYIGCYDYCQGGLCAKQEPVKTASGGKTTISTPTPTPTPVVTTKYKYQYVLTTGKSCSAYGAWSNWTTTKIEQNNNVKVETKQEKAISGYQQVYGVVDTKTTYQTYYETQTKGYDVKAVDTTQEVAYETISKPTVVGYATRPKTVTKYKDKVYRKITEPVYVDKVSVVVTPASSSWVSAGTVESKTPLSNTSTTHYTYYTSKRVAACTGCKMETITVYKVTKLKTVKAVTKLQCPKGTTADTNGKCDTGKTTTRDASYCDTGWKETSDGSRCYKNVETTEKYCATGTDLGNENGCRVSSTSKGCTSGYDNGHGCTIPVVRFDNYCATGRNTGSGCEVQVPKQKAVSQLIYGYKNGDPIYKTTTYYRSKTRTCSDGSTDYKWSESQNDSQLKAKGYTLTGKSEAIK